MAALLATPAIHYVIELQYASIDLCLMLNGIEIARGGPKDRKISQLMVNYWLNETGNQLELYAAVPDPAHIDFPVNLKCLVFRGPMGRQPEESEALARYEERDKTRLPAGSMQQVWKTSFDCAPNPGPWYWQSGWVIQQDQVSAVAGLRVLHAVVNALNAHDSTALMQLYRIFIDESARSYEMEPAGIAEQLQEWCAGWTPTLPLHPNLDEYNFAVEGNRRLLRIERKDGNSVFSTDPKHPKTTQEGSRRLYLARMDQEWIIVR